MRALLVACVLAAAASAATVSEPYDFESDYSPPLARIPTANAWEQRWREVRPLPDELPRRPLAARDAHRDIPMGRVPSGVVQHFDLAADAWGRCGTCQFTVSQTFIALPSSPGLAVDVVCNPIGQPIASAILGRYNPLLPAAVKLECAICRGILGGTCTVGLMANRLCTRIGMCQ